MQYLRYGLFPSGDFAVQIWGWDDVKKESIIDIELASGL